MTAAALVPARAGLRRIRLAVAGCGTVGGELLRRVEHERGALALRHGVEITVVRVLVRDTARARDVRLPRGVLTTDVARFLETDADVVVEALGGLDPAAGIAVATLSRGARYVTANKALVASAGGSLAEIARRHGGTLRFDASVGGGVPVLRLVESALGATPPRLVRGILNGTSNFVLTLVERGATLDDALAEARRRGFAEADAARDLDGRDAADKIAIVAWAAFGVEPQRVLVRRRGLLPDPARLVRLAQGAGGRLRLVAECALTDEGDVVASVEPTIVAADGALGRTELEGNRVELHAGWSAPLAASGPGAGGAPTATALLSDILETGAPAQLRDAAPVPDADRRALRWAVDTRAPVGRLLAALREAGVQATRCGGADAGWVHTAATPWPVLVSALDTLEAGGVRAADPVVARLDDGVGCAEGQ